MHFNYENKYGILVGGWTGEMGLFLEGFSLENPWKFGRIFQGFFFSKFSRQNLNFPKNSSKKSHQNFPPKFKFSFFLNF
jgi:hypothetical protein